MWWAPWPPGAGADAGFAGSAWATAESGSPKAVTRQDVCFFIFEFIWTADSGSRPMLMRTHERHQASRGGLNGSDGSGRTLLTVRDKARRRSVKVREHRGDSLRRSDRDAGTHKAGHGAKRRTEVAFVGSAGVVVGAAAGVPVVSAMVLRGGGVVLLLMPSGGHLMAVRVLGQLSLCLQAEASHLTQHAGRKCTSNREEHCEQQQEPKAESLHSSEVSTRGKVKFCVARRSPTSVAETCFTHRGGDVATRKMCRRGTPRPT